MKYLVTTCDHCKEFENPNPCEPVYLVEAQKETGQKVKLKLCDDCLYGININFDYLEESIEVQKL